MVNQSPIRRKKARPSHAVGFDKYKYHGQEDRRFHFDTMDTLPYWYSSAVNAFADVDGEEFLDVAENWIVDHWGIRSNPWRWEDEPRKQRLSDRTFSSVDHSHGSIPTLERFHTYLEWHAMWCSIGELMQRRALTKGAQDTYFTFEHQVKLAYLTAPPIWLADLRGPKPLEHQLWFAPRDDINIWVENINDEELMAELGLANGDGTIVVGSSHETESCKFRSSVRVKTALVSTETAGALMRALQSVNDSWVYRIPSDGDELEIDHPPYKLLGWLVDGEHELGIDERDPLRYGIQAIECMPSSKTVQTLNLLFVNNIQFKWIEAGSGNMVFIYRAWGDNRGDEREDRLNYDETVRSTGWRLRIDKNALKGFLVKIGFDLVVEIEVTRRNNGYGYHSTYDEETNKESRFDRVILLRRDGTIEAAEGRIGTWTLPSP